jgi:hypothetical protein
MATVAGVKIKPKTKRITSQSIRDNAKRDHSPKWEGCETLSAEEFTAKFRDAMRYYNLNFSGKDLKPKVIDWLGRQGHTRDFIQSFKKTKDTRSGVTMGAIASCLIKGMPDVRADFNQGRNTAEWLLKEVNKVIEDGKNDIEEIVIDTKKETYVPPVVTIQDRIREQAVGMSDELDAAIDSWILNPEAFDPKEFKVVNLLRGKGAKAAQARYIKSFFQSGHNELLELATGTDDQLIESYKKHSRKNIKKLIEFYEGIMSACEQIVAEAKVLKKPRKTKIKPAEDLVKKVKFRVTDDKLGITSVPPAQLIGAQSAVVFNTKTRKIGYYIATSSAGLAVKGTSLINFTEKSTQKTLRKPEVQLKEFKEQNTQKRVETWFTKSVKTTETVLNGRLNEDIVILKVFK